MTLTDTLRATLQELLALGSQSLGSGLMQQGAEALDATAAAIVRLQELRDALVE